MQGGLYRHLGSCYWHCERLVCLGGGGKVGEIYIVMSSSGVWESVGGVDVVDINGH